MKFKLPKGERLSPNHSRKLSEVLFEFTQAIVPLDSEPAVLEVAVSLAVLLWNVPLAPEDAQAETLGQLGHWLAQTNGLHLQFEIERLLDLRKTRYATDRRLVLEYQLDFTAKGPRLVALSVDLDRPAHRESGATPSQSP